MDLDEIFHCKPCQKINLARATAVQDSPDPCGAFNHWAGPSRCSFMRRRGSQPSPHPAALDGGREGYQECSGQNRGLGELQISWSISKSKTMIRVRDVHMQPKNPCASCMIQVGPKSG